MAEVNVADSQVPEGNAEQDAFFSLPAESESVTNPSQESYVFMETVSLETSADSSALSVHFQAASNEVSASGAPNEVETALAEETTEQNLPSKEEPTEAQTLSLSQYFDLAEPAQDTMGHTFFDNLSSGLSPMMKSVSDITELNGGIEVATEATSVESPTPTPSTVPSATNDDLQNQSASPPSMTPTATGSSAQSPTEPPTSSPDQPKPLLSTLFSEEKSGSDLLGKAFFDSLSSQPGFDRPPSEPRLSPPVGQLLDLHYADPREQDRFRDAWIPTKKTKQVLQATATSSQGSFFPEKSDLTMPGLIVVDQMVDPVKAMMADLNMESTHLRSCLTADHVTQDEAGLRQLIKAKCYAAAINLTGRLLTAMGQGSGAAGHPSRHTPFSLQLWFTRIALFIKTRRFQYAEAEAQPFGELDKPDMFYHFYPDVFPGRSGSMASFSFRLLIAEYPRFLGNYCKALDGLYSLLASVNKILDNLENGLAEDGENSELSEQHREASTKLWKSRECRVLFSVLNCMTAQKDCAMAIRVVQLLQQKMPGKTAEIQAALGKIYLQLGDVNAAMACFNQVALARTQLAPDVKYAVEDLVHKALICIVQNNYGDACKHFSQALTVDPGNAVLINNMAVCLLYVGRLKEAISLAEGVVVPGESQAAPESSTANRALHEGLLSNTCILYELESSQCDVKKKEVLQVVARNVGDSFPTSCLKIDVKAGK